MPFLVRHSSLGSRSGFERLIPQLSPDWSATSQKCPPIPTSPPIPATPWVEPEVSRTQVGLPLLLENSAKKSLPPAPRYSAPLASTTECRTPPPPLLPPKRRRGRPCRST